MIGEKEWEESQIQWWKEDKERVVSFFSRFNIDLNEFYDEITDLNYNEMQIIVYLISKIEKAIKICDFLDKLEKNEHDDVDVVKIYMLISHAEIAINNFQWQGGKKEMVERYFEPVVKKFGLNYKVRLGLGAVEKYGSMSCSEIFYKIRCEYTHEGNYTGKIFKNKNDDAFLYNIFGFTIKGEYVTGECNLTYESFLNIFMDALVENIKLFILKK
jgi:hypothetical protein